MPHSNQTQKKTSVIGKRLVSSKQALLGAFSRKLRQAGEAIARTIAIASNKGPIHLKWGTMFASHAFLALWLGVGNER